MTSNKPTTELERIGKSIQYQCVEIYKMFDPKENSEISREWVGGEILKYLRECRTHGIIDNASIVANQEMEFPFFEVYVKVHNITEVFHCWIGETNEVKEMAEREQALATMEEQ